MKINIEKSKNMMGEALEKATCISKKIAQDTKNQAVVIADKTQDTLKEIKTKKYNPLFLENYNSENFNLPNIIVIVDDAVRKGIDVCEGAIGWISNEKGVEVLNLYDEAIEKSNIEFIPAPVCDAIYCVDVNSRNKFINIENIFENAQAEKIAELQYIAHSLGAKEIFVEIYEEEKQEEKIKKDKKAKANAEIKKIKIADGEEKYIVENKNMNKVQRSAEIKASFEGSDTPVVPELKWFKTDENIKRLIDMRCNNQSKNIMKTQKIKLSGSSTHTISSKTAIALNSIIKRMKLACNINIQKEIIKEKTTTFMLYIQF